MTQPNKLSPPPETEKVTQKQLQDDLGELLHLFNLHNQSLILADRIAQAMYQQLAYPSLQHQVEKIAKNYTIEQLPNLNKAIELLRIVDPNKLDENTVTRLIGLEKDLNIELRNYQNNAERLYKTLFIEIQNLHKQCIQLNEKSLIQKTEILLENIQSKKTNLEQLQEYKKEYLLIIDQYESQTLAKKLYDKLSEHAKHLSQLCEDVVLNPLDQQAKAFLTKLEFSRTNLVELKEYEVEFMALREHVKIAVAPRITTAKPIGDDSIELTKIGRNENKQTLDTRWKAGEVFNYKEFRTQLLREAYIDRTNEKYKTMPEQNPDRTVKVKFN